VERGEFSNRLTCTEENFITKAYAQAFAAKFGVAVIAPDTSPRGAGIPGEQASYDLGSGAGFYVDATVAPWSKNYRMYTYITMGGHGAEYFAFHAEILSR
jgi:S-formylglutathione hydrolase